MVATISETKLSGAIRSIIAHKALGMVKQVTTHIRSALKNDTGERYVRYPQARTP